MDKNNLDDTQIIEIDERTKDIQITDDDKKNAEILSVEYIQKEEKQNKKKENNSVMFIVFIFGLIIAFIYFLPKIMEILSKIL